MLSVLVVAVGMVMTGVATWRVHTQAVRSMVVEFDGNVSGVAERIKQVMSNHIDALYGMRVLVEHSEELRADEFSAAAQDFIRRYDGLAALEWVERVPAAERTHFEQRMEGMGFPEFQITQEVAPGARRFRPAEARDEYFPVTYIEPLGPNRPALGFDVSSTLSWPLRQQSVLKGEVGGSQPLVLFRDDPSEPAQGWILHLPVYGRSEPMTPTERQQALRGFVLGVYRLADLFDSLEPTQTRNQLDLLVRDETDPANTESLFYRAGQPDLAAAGATPTVAEMAASRLAVRRTLRIGERDWVLWMRPTPAWLRERHTWMAVAMFMLGAVVTALFAGLIAELRRRHAGVQREVEQRTAELRASQEELAGILENSPNIIFVKDVAGRYLSVNQRYCEVYGQPREWILGKTDAEMFQPADVERFQRTDREAAVPGRFVHFEDTVATGGGEITSIVHKFPLLDGAGNVRAICAIATDITERKQMEQEQRAIERKLLEAQKLESLGVLAGGIAHDFNNLLTGVIGNASLAELEVEPDSTLYPLIRDIMLAATRAAELCRQMLDYSGRGAFLAGPVKLHALVQETLPLLRHSVSKMADLQLKLAPSLPVIMADATQVRQILMNLVINAAEALGGHPGSVQISTGLQTELEVGAARLVIAPKARVANYVRLSVADTGSGMSPETLNRILDPFFTTKFAGRGLGLAAVSGIVRGHDGALLIESDWGRGTTFHLLLPVADDALLASETKPAPTSEASWRGQGRILVVDDEPGVRHVARRALERIGMEVDLAENGVIALEQFRERKGGYTLVLLDLTMPELSGEEVWNEMRAEHPEVPVVLMSGFSQQQFAARWGRRGPAGFLQKPFSIEALEQILRKVVPPV